MHYTRPFRVLSLDGGGVRGLYTATLLDTLVRRISRERGVESLDLGKSFDLIAGTSTGGIIACGLASGLSCNSIAELYVRLGPLVFSDPMPPRGIKKILWAMRNRKKAANPSGPLRASLLDVFGSETLGQVYKRRGIGLCLPTVNLNTQQGLVLKTPHHGRTKQRDNDHTLVEACLATSAAPFFLPAARLTEVGDREPAFLVDGGLWANNPTLLGLIEAQALAAPEQPIEIVSVGTCRLPAGLATVEGDTEWGIDFWKSGRLVLTTALECQARATENTVRLLLPHLKNPTTVLRLPSSAASVEQARHMALDLASERALTVLQVLGKSDADMILSALHAGEPVHMQTLGSLLQEAKPLLQTNNETQDKHK
jgi:uncharacterized protein